MRIAAASTPVTQTVPKQNSVPTETPAAEGPKDEVVSSEPTFLQNWGSTLAGAAIGAGAGLYAGTGNGHWAGGLLGGVCGAGLGVAGTVGAARAGLDQQSMAIGGVSAVAGIIAGAVLGSHGHSALIGVGLAATGALAGGLIGFSHKMNEWMK